MKKSTSGLYIQSDFIDCYDYFLHDPFSRKRFVRLSKGGKNRRGILKELDNLSKNSKVPFRCIPYGTCKELWDRYQQEEINEEYLFNWEKLNLRQKVFSEVVVYIDENIHRGEGKIRMDAKEAMIKFPEYYASAFLNIEGKFPKTNRYLYVGDICCHFTYTSLTDEWRSNVGDVIIQYYFSSKRDNDAVDSLPYPIFAIDSITIEEEIDGDEDIYSQSQFLIDLNVAPQLPDEVYFGGEKIKFTDILPPKIAAEKIKAWVNK